MPDTAVLKKPKSIDKSRAFVYNFIMLSYDFDTFGIVYTAVTAALIVATVLPLIFFIVRGKRVCAATRVFRVLDIILILLLAVVWVVYVLTRMAVFGLSATATESGALLFALNGETLYSLAGAGELASIWSTVLGVAMMAIPSALAIVDLVLSFALRPRAVTAEETVSEPVEQSATEVAEEAQPEPVEKPTPEAIEETQPEPVEQPATEVAEETQPEPAEQPAPEAIEEAQPEPVEQPAPEATEEAQPEPAEEKNEPIAEEPAVEEPAAEHSPEGVAADATEEEKAERTVLASEPRSEVGRSVSDKTYASAVHRPEVPSDLPPAVRVVDKLPEEHDDETITIIRPPLPITRKLVITNRMNVVNMFGEYLNEKDEEEREKLSGSIGKIIIK